MSDVIRFCDVIDNCEDCPIYADTCDGVRKYISSLPSQGEWKRLIEYVPESNECLIEFDGYQCSVCGGKLWADGFNFWNYCPNCGARMKGGAE